MDNESNLPVFNKIDSFSFANIDEVLQTNIYFDFNVIINPSVLILSEVIIDFKVINSELNKVILDTKDLIIDSVEIYSTIDNKFIPTNYQLITNIKYPDLGNPLVVLLGGTISDDSLRLRIKSIADETKGKKEDNWYNIKNGRSFPFCYISCSHIGARTVFPCQDTPSAKFTFISKIKISSPYKAHIPGIEYKEPEYLGEYITYYHRQEIPISSYLFGLVFGETQLLKVSDRVMVYCEEKLINKVKNEFKDIETYLIAAEELFGPYEWSKYIIILCPEYPYMGMEHPNMVIIDDTSYDQTGLLIHELTHFWFGNLVTNSSFENFWINEGINTYAECLVIKKCFGLELYKAKVLNSLHTLSEEIEKVGVNSTHTALKPIYGHEDPIKTYNFIPYYKGALMMRMIAYKIGEENLIKIIKIFIQIYKYKSLNHEEFISFINKEVEKISQYSANNLIIDWDSWIFNPGFPPHTDEEEIKKLKA